MKVLHKDRRTAPRTKSVLIVAPPLVPSPQLQPPSGRVMILYVSWLVITSTHAVVAQQQNASMAAWCPDRQFDWVANSMGQSPCYVAGVLTDPCPSPFELGPLSPGQQYSLGPYTNCTCNSVFYSLISACTACQNMTWQSWTSFAQGCMTTYLSVYPEPIPANITIPNWAYLNVSATNDTFDVDAAARVAAGLASVTLTSASTTSSASNSATISTSASLASNSSHSPETNAGAIAGGVVGGVAGGALIMSLLFWLYTRRKASQPVAQSSPQEMTEQEMLPISPPSPSTVSSATAQPVSQPPVQNLYDPDDIPTSSTFPRVRNQRTPISGFLPNAGPYWGQVGQYYHGVGEV